MGIIKALVDTVSGGFADQWLEVIEPSPMSDSTCFVPGQLMSKRNGRGSNTKGTDNTVSNGSIIHVYDKQFMMLVDGGKVVDYTAEPGYYKVDNSSMPSMFNGQFKDTLKEAFSRIKYGGVTPQAQRVFYINLQELKGINFGTPNPLNYFDNFYNSELFMRAHGQYSIEITNPLQFYAEAIGKDAVTENLSVDFNELNRKQYLGEFLTALSSAFNQMSADGIRISHVTSKTRELAKYMADTLDEDWGNARGMEIRSVSIQVSYDEESQKLINMRNKGAMLSDQAVQQGYVAANISEGLKDAGSNAGGAMAGFMGMGVGMNAGAGILGGYHQNNMAQQQMQQQQPQQPQQTQQSQPVQQQSQPQAEGGWLCSCGTECTGKFCPNCGSKKPENTKRFCTECGTEVSPTAKFCPNCGNKL